MKNLIALFLIVMGCSSSQDRSEFDKENSREIILEINHYKAVCQGEYLNLCYLVKRDNQQEWTYFYDEIENFHYQWGYVYSLKVLEKDLDPATVPADASSKTYKLAEVISKVKVPDDQTFTINNLDRMIHSTKDLRLHVQNQFIQCVSAEVCNQMDSLLMERQPFKGLFKHGDKQDEIKLLSIEII